MDNVWPYDPADVYDSVDKGGSSDPEDFDISMEKVGILIRTLNFLMNKCC